MFDLGENSWKKKFQDLSAGRPPKSKEDFIKELENKGIKRIYIDLIYDELLNYLPSVEEFSIYPDERLIIDYNIDDEDLTDLIQLTLKTLYIKCPPNSEIDNWLKENDIHMEGTVHPTVFHIMDFLQWCGQYRDNPY